MIYAYRIMRESTLCRMEQGLLETDEGTIPVQDLFPANIASSDVQWTIVVHRVSKRKNVKLNQVLEIMRAQGIAAEIVVKSGRRTSTLRNKAMALLQTVSTSEDDTILIVDEDRIILGFPFSISDGSVYWPKFRYHDARVRIDLSRWPSTFSMALAMSAKTCEFMINNDLMFDEDIECVWGFEDRELGGRINQARLHGLPIENTLDTDFLIEGAMCDKEIPVEDFLKVRDIMQSKDVLL